MSQYHWNRIPDGIMHHVRTQAQERGITIRAYLIYLVLRDIKDRDTSTILAHDIDIGKLETVAPFRAINHGTHITIERVEQ